jgi:membrane-associated protease RseP (regulator of RpoE activity)
MHGLLSLFGLVLASSGVGAAAPASIGLASIAGAVWPYVLMFVGFSAVIFVHELGHFVVAKWCGIRVEKFAIGFFREIWGFTRGETRYSFNLLPLGGYVKMLGQEDFEIDKSGEISVKDDPRSFSNKSVGQRMAVISAGVVMNVIFAGVLFAIVFMIGLPALVTKVGYVLPNGPADFAGILPGDQIIAIDGKPIREFKEITFAIMLAEPLEELNFTVRRGDETKNIKVIPINSEEKSVQQIGIGPAITQTIVGVGPEFHPDRPDSPHPGDKVVAVDGKPVTDRNANDLIYLMLAKPTAEAAVTVERPRDPDNPNSPMGRVDLKIPSRIVIRPSDPQNPNTVDILGLTPLVRVDYVEVGGRAYLGGLEDGDVILDWGGVRYPTKDQILQRTRDACRREVGSGNYDLIERDIPIRVLRLDDGRERDLVVRPKIRRTVAERIKRAITGYGSGIPELGASFDLLADDLLRIGEIVPTIDGKPSPAAECGIEPGSLITKVDGTAVSRWPELAERLRASAGHTVTLTYTAPDGEEKKCDFPVPESLRTKLGLSCQSRILAINGQDTVTRKVTIDDRGVQRQIERKTSVTSPAGTRELLHRFVGQTVEVTYTKTALSPAETAKVTITPDMVDPWVGRIAYAVDLSFLPEMQTLRVTNPLAALGLGAKKTYYFILQVYTVMKRMIFSRSVGVETLSGPVGIVKIGGQVAQAGIAELLFFLAIISANLAVINFLPLPIVDGGHMVFLAIEKIKGSPVSIKIQMATQVVGLVLIIAAFLFVTLQDLTK